MYNTVKQCDEVYNCMNLINNQLSNIENAKIFSLRQPKIMIDNALLFYTEYKNQLDNDRHNIITTINNLFLETHFKTK